MKEGTKTMKVVILAGGFGSRLAEHTAAVPKPMVEIGPYPMLWHVMSIYAAHGYKDFVVACGYKAEVIKNYFDSFYIRHADYRVDLRDGSKTILRSQTPDWRVTLIDTGLNTLTGGRILRLRDELSSTFMVTYGDGVGDVDISALVAFHLSTGRLATVTAVRPSARFGSLDLDGERVAQFAEKPQSGEGWINGGFFVFEPGIFDYIAGDMISLEREPLAALAREGQLSAYKHHGFWQPMDTLREKRILDELWESGRAPWRAK